MKAYSLLHRLALSFGIFTALVHADVNVSGEAFTSRFWDCCKPSCAWGEKASVNSPVLSCNAENKPVGTNEGTGCRGGNAFSCAEQQPWAINDTFSYGFAGAYISPGPGQGATEDHWCCGCYQLDFTSEPLIGKSMIVQASNTAYDVRSMSRFSLAIPGGNVTSEDFGCPTQYGVSQSVFGQMGQGVGSKDDCQNLPEPMRKGCEWRFDWFGDAQYPGAKFRRVACPSELTDKTKCIRSDEKQLTGEASTSFGPSLAPPSSAMAGFTAALLGLLWV